MRYVRIFLAVVIGAIPAAAVGAVVAFVPAFDASRAEANSPAALDQDALASVVAIEADGAYVGTGVVVTRDGIVITSYDIAMLTLRDHKRLVIPSAMARAASVVALDAKNGIAALQMRGVIPPAAKLDAKGEAHATGARGIDLAVCRTANGATVQIEVRGTQPLSDCNVCPVFSPKTGRLKGIMIAATATRNAAYRSAKQLLSFIEPPTK